MEAEASLTTGKCGEPSCLLPRRDEAPAPKHLWFLAALREISLYVQDAKMTKCRELMDWPNDNGVSDLLDFHTEWYTPSTSALSP